MGWGTIHLSIFLLYLSDSRVAVIKRIPKRLALQGQRILLLLARQTFLTSLRVLCHDRSCNTPSLSRQVVIRAHRIEECLDVSGVHPGALAAPQVGRLAPHVQHALCCRHRARPRLHLGRPEGHRVPRRPQIPQLLPVRKQISGYLFMACQLNLKKETCTHHIVADLICTSSMLNASRNPRS